MRGRVLFIIQYEKLKSLVVSSQVNKIRVYPEMIVMLF